MHGHSPLIFPSNIFREKHSDYLFSEIVSLKTKGLFGRAPAPANSAARVGPNILTLGAENKKLEVFCNTNMNELGKLLFSSYEKSKEIELMNFTRYCHR